MAETFPMPDGFIPPENLDSDDTFQAMATFKLVGDDELQLIDIEGYQVGEEDTEGDTEAARQAEQASAASALQEGSPTAGAAALQGAGVAAGAERNMAAPAGTQANMPPPTFGEQMRQRFRAATGRR
jgi:hypothetical protein